MIYIQNNIIKCVKHMFLIKTLLKYIFYYKINKKTFTFYKFLCILKEQRHLEDLVKKSVEFVRGDNKR